MRGILQAFGVAFILVLLVISGLWISIESGLILYSTQEYTPAQVVEGVCKANGGLSDKAVFNVDEKEYQVSFCIWGLGEQANPTSYRIPRGGRKSSKGRSASSSERAEEISQADLRKTI
jgi:hypothetical protein